MPHHVYSMILVFLLHQLFATTLVLGQGCQSLRLPANGMVNYDTGLVSGNRPVGTVATYSCNSGYLFAHNSGTLHRTCQSSGLWSGTPPSCGVPCPVFNLTINGQVSYIDNYEVTVDEPESFLGTRPTNTIAVLTCDVGYTLDGDNERTCWSDGTWSGRESTCQIPCSSLSPPANGDLSYTSEPFVPGTVATYSCNSGYALDNPSTRTCQPDSMWSGSAPTCRRICSDLPPIANGTILYNSESHNARPVGTVASYSCNFGYSIDNREDTRSCQMTGQWSGSEPSCGEIPCFDLAQPTNGEIAYSNGTNNNRPVGSVTTYSCDTGYTLNGGSTRTCQLGGNWSGSSLSCQVNNCPLLTGPSNGQIDTSSGTTFNQTATYSCDSGYSLIGSVTRTCGASGNWTREASQCVSAVVTPSDSPMAGQSFSLNCSVIKEDSFSPNISFQWFRGQSVVSNSSVHSFDSLFLSDTGQYRCNATVISDIGSVTVSENYDIYFQNLNIQLRFRGLSNCRANIQFDEASNISTEIVSTLHIQTDEASNITTNTLPNDTYNITSEIPNMLPIRLDEASIITEITNLLSVALNNSCECAFNSSFILNSSIRCFDDSPQHVTYRAVLIGRPNVSAVKLTSLLNQWIEMNEIVVLQNTNLSVNSTCPLVIANLDSPECPESLIDQPVTPSSMPMPPDITLIIGAGVGGLAGLVVYTIIFCCLISSLKHCRSKSRDKKLKDNEKLNNGEVSGEVHMVSLKEKSLPIYQNCRALSDQLYEPVEKIYSVPFGNDDYVPSNTRKNPYAIEAVYDN